MAYKPSDYYVGVVNLFAVILPGAMAAYVLSDVANKHVFGKLMPEISGPEQGWVAYIIASYTLGHVLHLPAAILDKIYDLIYVNCWKRRNGDPLRDKARSIRDKAGGGQKLVSNVLEWSIATLSLRNPMAVAELNGLEADSKFFRSFVVVLVIWGSVFHENLESVSGTFLAVLIFLSMWRFCDRRWKRTKQAYTYLVILKAELK